MSILGLVSKGFAKLQADRRSWPSVLRPRPVLLSRVPERLWTRLRENKIRVLTVFVKWDGKDQDQELAQFLSLALQSLDLGSCNITDKGLVHLRSLPLEHLRLEGCEKITDAGLKHLRFLPLQRLNIMRCCTITDEGLTHLRFSASEVPLPFAMQHH